MSAGRTGWEPVFRRRGRRPRLQHSSAHDHKRAADSNGPIEGRLEMRLVLAAMLRLDSKMNQLFVFSKQLAVVIGGFGLMRND